MEAIFAAHGEGALRAAFDHDDRNEPRQGVERGLNIVSAGELAGLALIGQKNIHMLEYGLDVISPKIFRVVIGVERGGEAGLFHLKEQARQIGAQSAEKKKG